MFNIFNCIKALYTKNLNGLDIEDIETWQIMAVVKWLGYEEQTLPIIKDIVKYIFDLEPKIIFNMLYLAIPRQDRVPFIHKVEKEEIKINDLYLEIAKNLGWSEREIFINKSLLDKVILPNKTYWRKEFGFGN